MTSLQTRKNLFALSIVVLCKEGSSGFFGLSKLAWDLNIELLGVITTLIGIFLLVLSTTAVLYLMQYLASEWRLILEDMYAIEKVSAEKEHQDT